MESVLMKCGHTANCTYKGKPYCIICDCDEVAEVQDDLKGRKARCRYCGSVVDSEYSLPFFENNPNKKYDSYYCGCKGWD